MLLTEADLSIEHRRRIASPIRVGSVSDLGVAREGLLAELGPYFERLSDDPYLARQRRMALLKAKLPTQADTLAELERDYFTGQVADVALAPYVAALAPEDARTFARLGRVTRQRSIARLLLQRRTDGGGSTAETRRAAGWQIDRLRAAAPFAQDVDDFRAWPRHFAEASEESLAGPHLRHWLGRVADLVHGIHADADAEQLRVTLHFMRSLASDGSAAENSPEGIHEDGAAYIVSALVIRRENVTGGASQIFERLPDGRQELLLERTLAPGEFVFQADTGEERTFGNDLWHHVTPVRTATPGQPGFRDIIGLDIEL